MIIVKYSVLLLQNVSVKEDIIVKAEYDLELVCLLIWCVVFFFFFVDNVPFGEVAMAPPSFSSKPRKALVKSQVTCASVITRYVRDLRGLSKKFTFFFFIYYPLTFTFKNASKKLLLNSLLGHTVSSTAKPSMARQRIMEEERVRAVEAYRHLKKQKQQQHEARTAGLEKLKNLQWRWRLSSSVKFRNWEGAQDNRIWTVCVHWWTDVPAGEFAKMSLTTVRQTFASTGPQC